MHLNFQEDIYLLVLAVRYITAAIYIIATCVPREVLKREFFKWFNDKGLGR